MGTRRGIQHRARRVTRLAAQLAGVRRQLIATIGSGAVQHDSEVRGP